MHLERYIDGDRKQKEQKIICVAEGQQERGLGSEGKKDQIVRNVITEDVGHREKKISGKGELSHH